MRITQVSVVNYRALRDVTGSFDHLTSIIGDNNAGKSCVLAALDLFFSTAPRVEEKDFSDSAVHDPIRITVSFADLTPAERTLFESNLIDKSLVVTRTFLAGNPKDSGIFSVDAFVNPAFSACRNEASKTSRREIYRALQAEFDLPNVANADAIDDQLEAWENANPELLVRTRVAGFRGFKNVAIGQLRSRTDFIFVRAVREALDDVSGLKASPVKELLNTIAKQTIENNPDFQKFVEQSSATILALTSPENVPALAHLSQALSTTLSKYYSDSELIASWQPISAIPVPFPTAEIVVRNHGYVSDVSRVGHGLQRAIILTVLEYVANQKAGTGGKGEEFDEAQSDLIIAIEEPEIYQHPTKQRLFLRVLQNLAQGFSRATGIRIQIAYVTHSPLFLELPRCAEIRVARRVTIGGQRNVQFTGLTLQQCIEHLGSYRGVPQEQWFSSAQFAAKLHVFTPEIAEGFFGAVVVLVEGVSDKAILEAFYARFNRSCLAEGIVVVSADGKTKIDKPAIIFRELGIPIFIAFDNDEQNTGKDRINAAEYNRLFQMIADESRENCEDFPDRHAERYTSWRGNIETYIRSVVGPTNYDAVKTEMAQNFGVANEDCVKSPTIAGAVLQRFLNEGHKFERLEAIVASVDRLKMA